MNNINIIACISRVVLTGDERAFSQIVREYQEPIRKFFLVQTGGNEYLSDELSQETFIKVWQNLNSFHQLASFSTWLYRVAYNTWIDHLRRTRQYLQNLDFEDTLEEAETTLQTDAFDHLVSKERQQWVVQSVAQMCDPAKTVLSLFYLQDLSVRNISNIMNISQDNVRAILTRGRRKLKIILQQNNPYK